MTLRDRQALLFHNTHQRTGHKLLTQGLCSKGSWNCSGWKRSFRSVSPAVRRQCPGHPDLSDSSVWLPRTPELGAEPLIPPAVLGCTEGSMESVGWLLLQHKSCGCLGHQPNQDNGWQQFSSWISMVGGEGRHKSSKGHQILVPLQERV